MGEMHVRAVKINTFTYAYICGGVTAAVRRGAMRGSRKYGRFWPESASI